LTSAPAVCIFSRAAFLVAFLLDGEQMAMTGGDIAAALKRAASGFPDTDLIVLEAATGRELYRRKGFPLDVSRDGKLVAVAGKNMDNKHKETVQILDVRTGKELLLLRDCDGKLHQVRFSSDGKHVAYIGEDPSAKEGKTRTYIKVREVGTGKVIQTLDGATGFFQLSRDGQRLAATGQDGKITLWDLSSGEIVLAIENPQGGEACLAFSADDSRMAAGGHSVVSVWDVPSGKLVQTFRGHLHEVSGVAFSPDGRRVASVSMPDVFGLDIPGEVKVWDLATGQEVITLRGHRSGIFDVAFSSDGRRLATASATEVIVWDGSPREELDRGAAGHDR
jgi:WD40 repeat protein